ncbi:MAG TPA: Nif3-like dinuclear metal center hexameric protein [Polyangiaceae bacterium]
MPLPLDRVVAALESIAPVAHAEDWDNVGLLLEPAGDRRDSAAPPQVARVLLCIDFSEPVLAEALAGDVDLVVAYHPPLFRPVNRLRARVPGERVFLAAARAGLALYSPHTALDAAPGGVNDWLAGALGTGQRGALFASVPRAPSEHKLVVFVPATHADALRSALAATGAGVIGAYSECSFELAGSGTFVGGETASPVVGERGRLERVSELRLELVCPAAALGAAAEAIRRVHPYEEPAWDIYPLAPRPAAGFGVGRAVTLDEPATLDVLVERVKRHVGRATLRVASAPAHRDGGTIRRAAVCAGSGGSVLDRAEGYDLFLTGELSHHALLARIARGSSVILCEHSSSERGFLPAFERALRQRCEDRVEVQVSQADREPVEFR